MLARFPDRLRLPLDFEPDKLAADRANFSSAQWIAHFVKQNYDGDWSVIALRGPAGARHPVQTIYSDPGRSDFEDTAMLAGSPYFRQVLTSFACPLHAVRLMRLTPGSLIKEHRDHDLAFEQGMVRIHVPAVTKTSADFRLNGSRCILPAGTKPLPAPVRPAQPGQPGGDGVHRVIDAVANDWVAACSSGRWGPPAGGGLARSGWVAGTRYPLAPYGKRAIRRAYWCVPMDSSGQFC